jgi:Holliday junction resolvase
VLREVYEIMWILKGLKKHLPKGVEEKLKQVMGGRDFAALDKDSSSRNTQFELRIASYFCQTGYSVDMSNLTDIVATHDLTTYFVECKRVTSSGALNKRLKEAKKQLKTRLTRFTLVPREFGVIAIDVTKVAFKFNGLTLGLTADHTRDVIQDQLKK